MKPMASIKIETKSELIYNQLKASILKGDLPADEKLVINQLAEHFSTSPIPVREAVSRLEAENLVSVVPHTGVYVKGIDLAQLRELYPLRGVLEGYAVRLAAENLTSEDIAQLQEQIAMMDVAAAAKDHQEMGRLNLAFHKTLYKKSGNATLIGMIDDLWQKTALARLVFKFRPYRAKDSNKEHRQIVEALEAGNTKRAEKLIIRQSEKTLKLLDKSMEKKEVAHATQRLMRKI